MGTFELLSIFLAVLILVALIAIVWLYIAVRSFKKKRDIQEREHNKRLLKEIIDWTVDIAKISSEGGLPIRVKPGDKKPKRLLRMNWALEYQTVNARAKYIMVIAATMNGEGALQSSIKTINSKLEELTKLLWEFVACEENSAEEQELMDKVNNSERKLQEYVANLIDEANAIKHREAA